MPGNSNNTAKMISTIIDIVAENPATDFLKQSAELDKEAARGVRRSCKPLSLYLECFLLPAQGYTSFAIADRASATSQSLLYLFSSANFSSRHSSLSRQAL